MYVGSITSDTMVVTDEMGFADVDINSLNKGYQYRLRGGRLQGQPAGRRPAQAS